MARIAITSGYYGDTTVDHYGSGTTTEFIPKLYSKKVLKNFNKKTFYDEICNTDYAGEIKNQGDTVIIRKTPDLTVGTYAVGGTLSYQVPEKASTSLVIDKARYVAFRVDDIDAVQSDIGLINTFANDAADKLKIAVDAEVLAYMATGAAAANKGATAGALSANLNLGSAATNAGSVAVTSLNAVDQIVLMNQVLDEANQPSEGRFIVLPAWYCAMLKLGDLRRADLTGDGSGVIRNGVIGMVDRTTIYQSNNLPHVTDTNEIFTVIAGTKEATTFAAQISKTDSLQIPDSFGEYWRTLLVFGRSVVQPTALSTMFCKRG